jgi:hypothetical protein
MPVLSRRNVMTVTSMLASRALPFAAAPVLLPAVSLNKELDWFEAYEAAWNAEAKGYALIRAALDAAEKAEAAGSIIEARNLLLLASGATHQRHEAIERCAPLACEA